MCNHVQSCYVLTCAGNGEPISARPAKGHVLLVQVQQPSVTPTTFSQVTYISVHLHVGPSCYAFCTLLNPPRKGRRTGLRILSFRTTPAATPPAPFHARPEASCPYGTHIPSIAWQSQPRQPLQLQAELAT